MDVVARGLLIAAEMEQDGFFDELLKERYAPSIAASAPALKTAAQTLKNCKPTSSTKAKSPPRQARVKNS